MYVIRNAVSYSKSLYFECSTPFGLIHGCNAARPLTPTFHTNNFTILSGVSTFTGKLVF